MSEISSVNLININTLPEQRSESSDKMMEVCSLNNREDENLDDKSLIAKTKEDEIDDKIEKNDKNGQNERRRRHLSDVDEEEFEDIDAEERDFYRKREHKHFKKLNLGTESVGNLTVTKYPVSSGTKNSMEHQSERNQNLRKATCYEDFSFKNRDFGGSDSSLGKQGDGFFNNNNNESLMKNLSSMTMSSLLQNGHHFYKNDQRKSLPSSPSPKAGVKSTNDLSSLSQLSKSIGNALLNLNSISNNPTMGLAPQLNNNTPLSASYLSSYLSTLNNTGGGANNGGGINGDNLPQLLLASGTILQGIQGAQLLIPSPQGLMTQTVLTIPITQPESPPTPSPPHKRPSSTEHSNSHPYKQMSQSGSFSNNQSRSSNSPGEGNSGNIMKNNNRNGPMNSPPPHRYQSNENMVRNKGQHKTMISEKEREVEGCNGSSYNRSSSGTNGSSNYNNLHSSSLISSTLQNWNSPSHTHSHHGMTIGQPQHSPSSSISQEYDNDCDFLDRCSDNDDDQMIDGINLDEIKEFAKAFKLRRLSLGLTQTQVGQALSVTEGPAYSQSAICSALAWQLAQSEFSHKSSSNRPSIPQPHHSMFEKLDITPKSAQKIKPVLENWMKEAEERYRNGHHNLNEFVGMEPSKKRKRRTSFTPQALEILNVHFERNTHPSGAEITTLAHQLGYEREVIRIWFCNKRQALKNTVRMMSKGNSPC